MLSSGLLTSGGDGVTRMVWLKGQEVEYRNIGGIGAVPVGLVRRPSGAQRHKPQIVAYC